MDLLPVDSMDRPMYRCNHRKSYLYLSTGNDLLLTRLSFLPFPWYSAVWYRLLLHLDWHPLLRRRFLWPIFSLCVGRRGSRAQPFRCRFPTVRITSRVLVLRLPLR